MTRHSAALIAASLFLACSPVLAQTAPDAKQPIIKLTAVVMAMPAGTPWLSLRNFSCLREESARRASGGREPQDLPPYTAAFNAELEKAGFKTVSDDNLFNRDEQAAADYQVAAVVTAANVRACVGNGSLFGGKLGDARGNGSMKVDWQVYAPLRKEVVARISTSGAKVIEDKVADGLAQLLVGSFAGNAQELAANPQFRAAVSAKQPSPNEVIQPEKDGQAKIALSGSLKAPKAAVADAVGSVVTVLTGSGSGSAELISDDGYMLTNAHVVGEEKEVRVRWSDGIEKTAQVIRVSKPRDVAIIKTDPRERLPLPIQRGAVSPGQKVFAIGSPLGKQLQSTVSSGIISNTSRISNGMRYVQSDVAISHGSSGGPLLNETGAMIGIAVSGVDPGTGEGLNFFIPIGDAMDFLNLEQN